MSSYVATGTVTISAGGSGHLVGTAFGIIMAERAPNLSWAYNAVEGPVDTNFNWTYSNGALSISGGQEINDFDLSVVAGGQVLVGVFGGAPSNNQQLTVWTRK